nr:oligopeptide transporter 7 [Quercus suber]
MHSKRNPSISCLAGKSLRHRELSGRAGSSYCSDHRRFLSPELHVPNMDSRKPSMRSPLLSQPILLHGARSVYSIHLVSAVKLFYKKELTFMVALVVVITSQVMGFCWAVLFRRYLVDSAAICGGPKILSKFRSSAFPLILGALASPWFATANVAAGFALLTYVITPLADWLNIYKAKAFPIFSDGLFTSNGQSYNVSAIIDPNFRIDIEAYELKGPLYMSTFFAINYGVKFACIAATVVHVFLFHGRGSGYPVANICFKVYGYISMKQGITFLQDFKLGHYMKIPPRAMFMAQVVGAIIAAFVHLRTAWWLMDTVPNICDRALLPAGSPWTCPGDHVFYDASVIWGLIGPRRIFGDLGYYFAINWFFLAGAIAPVLVWLAHKVSPDKHWIRLITMPVLLGATINMPPAPAVNYTSWILIGFASGFVAYRYYCDWWSRHNYVLSGAFDAGLAFMGVVLYLYLGMEHVSLNWWGSDSDGCPLGSCLTAQGVVVDGCLVKESIWINCTKLCMISDLLGDSDFVTGIDVARHHLAACRTMLQKFTQKFTLGESALEEKGDAVREWTSRRPYKEREKKKLKQGNCYFAVSPGVLTSRTYIYGSHSGVVELTRSEFYQTGCDSEISSQGYDKVNCKLKSVELSELWIFMPCKC